MKNNYAIFLLFVTAVSTASAQTLFKCKDANGKTTYSDSPCEGSSIETIDATPVNVFDGSAMRSEAAKVRQTRQSGVLYPDEPQYLTNKPIRSSASTDIKPSDIARPKSRSYGCTMATNAFESAKTSHRFDRVDIANKQREMEKACGLAPGPLDQPPLTVKEGQYLNKQRRREQQAEQPIQPSTITSCDKGGCWDDLGTRYNRGAGNTLINSNSGRTCQKAGGQLQCN